MRHVFIILTALIWSGNALAQSQTTDIRPNANRLMGDALLEAFKGVTHDGAYNFDPNGDPGRFYKETHHETGEVTYSEGEQTTGGAWIIRKDIMCYVYPPTAMPGGCFRVYQVGNCYYFYNDGIPEFSDELDRDYWTARSVKQGQRPDCGPGIS